jgi:integrase
MRPRRRRGDWCGRTRSPGSGSRRVRVVVTNSRQARSRSGSWFAAHASPSFAAWLQAAAFTGLRPGELDALRRANVDLDRSHILVVEQFSAKTRTFTLPKNGLTREAPPTEPAREAIVALPVEGEFCFVPIRGQHWTASARAYHWKAVRGAAGWAGSLYLATRHFAGWYMVNVLDVPSEDVAIALGHTDGGELVRRLYGHRDHERALDRVTAAYGQTASFTQMRLV